MTARYSVLLSVALPFAFAGADVAEHAKILGQKCQAKPNPSSIVIDREGVKMPYAMDSDECFRLLRKLSRVKGCEAWADFKIKKDREDEEVVIGFTYLETCETSSH